MFWVTLSTPFGSLDLLSTVLLQYIHPLSQSRDFTWERVALRFIPDAAFSLLSNPVAPLSLKFSCYCRRRIATLLISAINLDHTEEQTKRRLRNRRESFLD